MIFHEYYLIYIIIYSHFEPGIIGILIPKHMKRVSWIIYLSYTYKNRVSNAGPKKYHGIFFLHFPGSWEKSPLLVYYFYTYYSRITPQLHSTTYISRK